MLGIVSLFLFAGLDINFTEVRSEGRIIVKDLIIYGALLVALAFAIGAVINIPIRTSFLVSLALITPSTGFILATLDGSGLSDREKFWIRSTAIATELLALTSLFIIIQSESIHYFAISTLSFVFMIVVLPPIFKFFANKIAPLAPNSEFAFLLMIAVVCAYITRQLGVYYLVGAFIVGVTAQRLREHLPALTSEKMLHALEVFASFFVPFYFFNAGLHLQRSDFNEMAVMFGLIAFLFVTPLRLLLVAIHRKISLGESFNQSMPIGLRQTPTLVFSLVVVSILRTTPSAPKFLFGGIVIYTLMNTILPGLVFKIPPPEYDKPRLQD